VTQPIEVRRHPRARRYRLFVDPTTGNVRLTLPPRAALKHALTWAEAQRGWIAQQQARLPAAQPFVPGAAVPFGNAVLTIDWDASAPRRIERIGDCLRVGGPAETVNARVVAWLKRQALARLSEDTAEIAARAGVSVARVAIGDARARWGSCTSSGAIRYSWRLILAPDFVRRAVVAHELAHRVHLHHGPVFHALAAELLGDSPAAANAWLRRYGPSLHWLGRSS